MNDFLQDRRERSKSITTFGTGVSIFAGASAAIGHRGAHSVGNAGGCSRTWSCSDRYRRSYVSAGRLRAYGVVTGRGLAVSHGSHRANSGADLAQDAWKYGRTNLGREITIDVGGGIAYFQSHRRPKFLAPIGGPEPVFRLSAALNAGSETPGFFQTTHHDLWDG
jgi:hypothetical protein